MAGDESLGKLRVAIDACDDELLDVLNKRARLVEQVAQAKQDSGGSFYVPKRERAIIDRLQQRNDGPFPDTAIRPVFQEVISACLSLEKGVRVAYLGPEATFTHQAVKRHFGTSAQTMPCGSIGAVFGEVERGGADYGVVPVENSSEGVVNHTLDSFIDSALHICAEIVVDIDHCLLARSGVGLSEITHIYSHPQALAQCRGWLTTNAPHVTQVETSSTTEAARRAAEDATGAAICAELATRFYNLDALRRSVQDAEHNVTRFLVINSGEQDAPTKDAEHKTTVLLAAPDEAGFLYEILKPLSDAGINMTKIESRPSRRQVWDYVFFLDLDGHCMDEGVAPVLAEIAAACDLFKVVGSYRKADSI